MAYYAASIDATATNRSFAESLGLDYPILSDPDKDAARAYGVLRALGLYAARTTIYIGKDGNVLFIDTDVNPKTAAEDMVARLTELGIPPRE